MGRWLEDGRDVVNKATARKLLEMGGVSEEEIERIVHEWAMHPSVLVP
jgi:hypothetical protein